MPTDNKAVLHSYPSNIIDIKVQSSLKVIFSERSLLVSGRRNTHTYTKIHICTHTHPYATHTSAPSSLVASTTRLEITSTLWLLDDLFFDHVNHLIWNSQVLDGASTNVTLWYFPKPISILPRANSRVRSVTLKSAKFSWNLPESLQSKTAEWSHLLWNQQFNLMYMYLKSCKVTNAFKHSSESCLNPHNSKP